MEPLSHYHYEIYHCKNVPINLSHASTMHQPVPQPVKKKNKSFKEEIISLKTQLEEGKRMEEVIQIHMIKKEKECENLEKDVMTLRAEVNKINNNLKISQVLENILNIQRPSKLGY
jgi:hypothetical protein